MEMSMSEDGKYRGQHSVIFTEKTWYERQWNFLKYLPKQIPLFATVTVSFWGVAEILSEIGGETLSLKNLAIPGLLTALVVSLYRAYDNYVKYQPDSLASESSAAKAAFKNGKPGWQFALAREMLAARLLELDWTLNRIERGSQYIQPRQLSGAEYFAWLCGRPEILTRLVRAVAIQCTSELTAVIAQTKCEKDLENLKSSIDQLASLYEETVKFELDVRGVKPPNNLENIHGLTFNWSLPVREGVGSFVSILDSISKVNVKRVASGHETVPNFGIEFLPPSNLDAFMSALEMVDQSDFTE
jgi:hypothetical protein